MNLSRSRSKNRAAIARAGAERLRPLLCVASVLLAATACSRQQDHAPKLIYWYTIDTIRADVLGGRRNGQSIMPELEQFAAEHISFDIAYAQASFTKVSVSSMFTGLWPSRLGVRECALKVEPQGDGLLQGFKYQEQIL